MVMLLSRETRELVIQSRPLNIIIETIRGCSLKCPFCPLQVDPNIDELGTMSDQTFENVLSGIPHLPGIQMFILHNIGEPLLDPRIFDRIKKIGVLGKDATILIDSHLSTDFDEYEMVRSGLSILQVALDGATQESYSRYRVNGSLRKVLANIAKLNAAKKSLQTNKPLIRAKTVLFRHLIGEVDLIADQAKRAGADEHTLATAVFRPESGMDPKSWLPEEQHLSRYDVKELQESGKLILMKNHITEESCCTGILGSIPPVIGFNGDVFPCCYSCTIPKFRMGNVNEESFQDIWLSEKYVNFRRTVFENRYQYDVCRDCSRPSNRC